MTRYEANKKIIKILSATAENNPDLRFIQILWQLGIINLYNGWLIEDRFYEESEQTLKKLTCLSTEL